MEKNVQTDFSKEALRCSNVSIVGNVVLSVLKLIAGIVAHSGAMISDAVHSASDVFGTIIVIIGVKFADKPEDDQHPYGHERFECVAAIILSAVLLATGIMIGVSGFEKIFGASSNEIQIPGRLALVAAIVSILTKEWMYWYTIIVANRIHSSALKANAWHHRSDALSSVGALIGIAGARMGYPIMDAIASVVICLFILKVSIDIFREGIDKMVDKALPAEQVALIRSTIENEAGVEGIHALKTRMFGSREYVDAIIEIDKNATLYNAHIIANNVHDTVEREYPAVKHCMVHIHPVA